MINGIFPLPVQAAAQAVADSPIVVPFQSAANWIDDEIAWVLVWDN